MERKFDVSLRTSSSIRVTHDIILKWPSGKSEREREEMVERGEKMETGKKERKEIRYIHFPPRNATILTVYTTTSTFPHSNTYKEKGGNTVQSGVAMSALTPEHSHNDKVQIF